MIDVLVVGALGKMGALTARTVAAQEDLRVVGLVDPKFAAGEAPPPPVDAPAFADVGAALAAVRADVAVEFSLPASVYENSLATLAAGVHTVVGATGLGDEQLAGLREQAAASGARLFVAPNFALGAVLLMEFARQAARHYEHAEVVELHETSKKDAPSGTALRTARLMAEAEGSRIAGLPGDAPSRGLDVDGVRVHSVRLPGLVAHQEVLIGGENELLTLRHDSYSRASFMPGVLLAVRRVSTLKDSVVGLENLLGE
ncbi:MAG TPA: 4-hydroxy-tetrahydrodipicolinate reductase [Thermoleophilia bacterium]|nr:4-hydroxy-tetrahydrodipicolinate reductase [Thermoleophilia bacterium]